VRRTTLQLCPENIKLGIIIHIAFDANDSQTFPVHTRTQETWWFSENVFTESSYTLRIKLMLALFTELCSITNEEMNN